MVQPGGVDDVRGVEADRFGNPSFWYCWPGAAQKERGDMLSVVAVLVCFFLLLSLLSHCCNYNRAQLIDMYILGVERGTVIIFPSCVLLFYETEAVEEYSG